MSFDKESVLKMIKAGQTPEQLVLIYLNQMGKTNPFVNNLLTLAYQNDNKGLEKIARNVCEQRGLDYDMEIDAFKEQLGVDNK